MRTFAALRLATLLSGLAALTACKPKVLMVVTDNAPTINLFGFEESQLHHIHNTIELRSNIFLVRYDPKKPDALEWINCPIPATYSYRQANGRRVESIYIQSQQELQAKVPVNYARFAGYVKNGKALEFNYVTIGSYELLSDFKIPTNDDDCNRATHYVSTLSVGAFNFAEQRHTEGKLEATENTTGVGVGIGGGRSSGEMTSMGDLASCMDDQAAFNDCFTPLQVMMMPIPKRNWTDGAPERVEQPPQSTQTASGGQTAAPQVGTDLSLQVDAQAWGPGSYMAMALQNILINALRINLTTNFGFDDLGSTLLAGYLTASHSQASTRQFEVGKTYAIIGAGATGANLDLFVRDPAGNVIAADTEPDGNPAVVFVPPSTDIYQIELSLVGAQEEIGAVVVLQDGGMKVDTTILQSVFQQLLNVGAMASTAVQEEGWAHGLVFHEGTWSVQGTILYAGEAITQRGIQLGGQPAVFVAVAHDQSFNIDLDVTDAQSGQTWANHEPDSTPFVVLEESNPNSSYDLRVIYGQGDAGTLATSLILQPGS